MQKKKKLLKRSQVKKEKESEKKPSSTIKSNDVVYLRALLNYCYYFGFLLIFLNFTSLPPSKSVSYVYVAKTEYDQKLHNAIQWYTTSQKMHLGHVWREKTEKKKMLHQNLRYTKNCNKRESEKHFRKCLHQSYTR